MILLSTLFLLPLILSGPTPGKVLLISLDGFRHDLLTEKLVPNIYKFAIASSWFVNGVKSQMMTVTAPNHLSIVTGLREDEHGIIGNYFWDRTKKTMYDQFNKTRVPNVVDDSERSHWSKTLGRRFDPIWLLNQNNGGRSTVINWPAGERELSEEAGVKMTRWLPEFEDNSNLPGELQLVIDSLLTNNLVLWYIAEPDNTLHEHGFYGGQLENTLTMVDELFGSLMKKMEEQGLLQNTDIILTADHGHIQILPGTTLCINRILGNLINDAEYHAGDSNIYHSNPAKVQEIYETLRKVVEEDGLPYRVYLQKDVPHSWHYVNTERTGDIFIEAMPGGQEMKPLLVMGGPSFVQDRRITVIPENIDLFPMMNRLLGIREPKNSGNANHLCQAVRCEKYERMSIHCDDVSSRNENSYAEVYLTKAIMLIVSVMILV